MVATVCLGLVFLFISSTFDPTVAFVLERTHQVSEDNLILEGQAKFIFFLGENL